MEAEGYCARGNSQRERERERCENWSAPPEGWVKRNADASFFATTGEIFGGAIIRDYLGRVLLSS